MARSETPDMASSFMIERLWRTVKSEDVYIRDYKSPAEARFGLSPYFVYYNLRRCHRSLGRKKPAAVYGLAKKSEFDMIWAVRRCLGSGLGRPEPDNRYPWETVPP